MHLTPERTVQLYKVFQDDMPGDQRQLQNEVVAGRQDGNNECRRHTRQHGSRYQSRPKPQHVHRSHHTGGDVCIDRHDRAIFQRNAASHELSALYNDN